jgi:ketosteroid isomerase-like protein
MTSKEVIVAFSEALGSGDIPGAFSFFSSEAKWHQPGNNKFSGTKNDPEEIGKMLSAMMGYTEGTLVIRPNGPMMVNASLVASPIRFSATSGGKSIDMTGIDLYEVKDGKIINVWLFSDDQEKEDGFWGR